MLPLIGFFVCIRRRAADRLGKPGTLITDVPQVTSTLEMT